MTRHALVTGATGGLGRELVAQLLAAGYRVTATGRNRSIGVALSTHFIAADLVTDPLDRLLDDVDVVFHLAANSSPWGRYEAFHRTNVVATRRLLEASRAADIEAFVYASTPSIYAERRDQLDLTEESPVATRFANGYAATKHQAEQEVLAANSTTLTTIAIRPRAIIGPHDTVLLPRLLRAARAGRLPMPGGGSALIELTDVRDVASAFLAADHQRVRAAGQVINISSGDPQPLRNLLTDIFARLDKPVRLVSIPIAVAMTAATVMERVAALLPGRPEPPATRYAIMVFGFSQTMRLDRARDLLCWMPRHSASEAIAHALGTAHA